MDRLPGSVGLLHRGLRRRRPDSVANSHSDFQLRRGGRSFEPRRRRYARSLRPTTLRAVHFVIDTAEADTLREDWMRADRGVVLDYIDCPDRRLPRCAAELVSREAALPGTHVTAVLPRRSYSPLLGRLLHDHTADKIAAVLSNIQHSVATIVPFDVRSRLEVLHARQVAHEQDAAQGTGIPAGTPPSARSPFPAEPAASGEPTAPRQPVAPGQPPAPNGPRAPRPPGPACGPPRTSGYSRDG